MNLLPNIARNYLLIQLVLLLLNSVFKNMFKISMSYFTNDAVREG